MRVCTAEKPLRGLVGFSSGPRDAGGAARARLAGGSLSGFPFLFNPWPGASTATEEGTEDAAGAGTRDAGSGEGVWNQSSATVQIGISNGIGERIPGSVARSGGKNRARSVGCWKGKRGLDSCLCIGKSPWEADLEKE